MERRRIAMGLGEHEGLEGVLRFQIDLHPKKGRLFRHILVGQKSQPSLARTGGGRDRLWGWLNRIADARKDSAIGEQGSFILSVRNPQVAAPFKIGLGVSRQAKFPDHLRKIFQGRRYAAADPPEILDYEKVEFLLIGAHPDPQGERGMGMKAGEEDWNPVEVFQNLKVRMNQDRSNPFLEGSRHRSLLPLESD